MHGNRIAIQHQMSAPKPVISNVFESSASDRLARFITQQGIASKEVTPLTPDASTRKYYRIGWKKRTAVAAVYPEPFDPEFHPYLDVTRLFLDCDIPVPEIYAVDGNAGIIVQEDLGDRQLFHIYDDESEEQCDEYKEQAIALIAKIQKATESSLRDAFDRESPGFRRSKTLVGTRFLFRTLLRQLAARELAPRGSRGVKGRAERHLSGVGSSAARALPSRLSRIESDDRQ